MSHKDAAKNGRAINSRTVEGKGWSFTQTSLPAEALYPLEVEKISPGYDKKLPRKEGRKMIVYSNKKDLVLLDLYYETGNTDFLSLFSQGWTYVYNEERAEELRAMIQYKKA